MRAALVLAVLVAAATASAAGSALRVTLTGAGPTAKANAKWHYQIRAVDAAGRPVRGRLTMQVLDPIGGVHSVQYADTTRNIVARPFVGTFRDFVRWPADARGFTLRLRATVKAGGQTRRVHYDVRIL